MPHSGELPGGAIIPDILAFIENLLGGFSIFAGGPSQRGGPSPGPLGTSGGGAPTAPPSPTPEPIFEPFPDFPLPPEIIAERLPEGGTLLRNVLTGVVQILLGNCRVVCGAGEVSANAPPPDFPAQLGGLLRGPSGIGAPTFPTGVGRPPVIGPTTFPTVEDDEVSLFGDSNFGQFGGGIGDIIVGGASAIACNLFPNLPGCPRVPGPGAGPTGGGGGAGNGFPGPVPGQGDVTPNGMVSGACQDLLKVTKCGNVVPRQTVQMGDQFWIYAGKPKTFTRASRKKAHHHGHPVHHRRRKR